MFDLSHRPTRATLAATVIGAAILAAPTSASANLVFNLAFLPGTDAPAQAAFTEAAAAWSAVLANNVTVNLTVGTESLGAGILAAADSVDITSSYGTFRTALTSAATSANDGIAVANLQPGPNLSVLINHTLQSTAAYVDSTGANTSTIRMNNAVAKALGLPIAASNLSGGCIGNCDGYIVFSTNFGFDTDRSDGIGAGLFDFVGIAIHEIGHALGFISGVDILDSNPDAYNDDAFTYISPLDLFRCSATSAALGAIDWTASTDAKSFSLDRCGTSLATFSTGIALGDGRQASHWQDNLGLGVMDPTAAPGERVDLTALDLTAMDAIGWTLAQATATPEPASALVLAFGLVGLAIGRRGRAMA